MTDNPRRCRNCACVFRIERPALQPPGMSAQEYDALPREQWVCRLNPPAVFATPKGNALMQGATHPDSVCWHWCPEGTLPGEQLRAHAGNGWGGPLQASGGVPRHGGAAGGGANY